MEEMTEEKPPMTTSCRDCVFATWDDKTQVGCQFDRIEKFESNGAEIVGQDDGEKQYLLIVGRFCNACRNKEWGRNNPRRKWKKLVQERIRVQLDIIINVDGDSNLEDVARTVESTYRQNPQPKSVVVAYNPEYDRESIVDIVSFMKDNAKGPWRVEKLTWEEASKYCKGTYYAVFNAGYTIQEDFLETINRSLNEDMTRFVALLPDDDGNGLVVLQCGHSLEELFDIADETGTGHMIKDFLDL